MTLFMETTKIPAEITTGQIHKLLGSHGAVEVLSEYRDGYIVGVSFRMVVQGRTIPFRLPCRWEAILRVLKNQVKRWPTTTNKAVDAKIAALEDQARRIAWRQILRWVEAQMALIDTAMVSTMEVFLPYVQTGINETFFERLEAGKFKALPAPGEDK
jgi:hypothetical protein